MNETTQEQTGLEIAIIGMACRFPGADGIDEFWKNISNGRESIHFFSDEELKEAGLTDEVFQDPNYIKAFGELSRPYHFDANFFNYTPREARGMDPQVRLLHEYTWAALEDAAVVPGPEPHTIGLFAGAAPNFAWEAVSLLSQARRGPGWFSQQILVNKDFAATRIAYNLGLTGPAITLSTACSTSLTAVDSACRALLTGQCDIAVAGGITVCYPSKKGYQYQEGMIYSADGHTRAFDHRAMGSVFGEGVGMVVLKPLEDAIEDRDHIYAVIRGTAVNNDGNRKVGYTAPGIKGQAAVIRAARHMAQVEAESITYIEAHGTATPLGDPVEIKALKNAFNSEKKQFCAIGSVKTNIGHLDAASGVAGLIKTALMLKHRVLPASLHYEKPNSKIDFQNSPFYVNTRLTPWDPAPYPRRAGVSSFGIGGTNAHALLEEWTGKTGTGTAPTEPDQAPYRLFPLSAKTRPALDHMARNLGEYVKQHPDIHPADASYTLLNGRKTFAHRMFALCKTTAQAAELFTAPQHPQAGVFHDTTGQAPKVVFLFPGQGAQYVDMGRDLYRTEPLFREEMDRCFQVASPLLGYDLKDALYPQPGAPGRGITQTEAAQPLLFGFEYALAKLLMSWGITPFAMMGHSIGEYTAACLAGVFSPEDAVKLVTARGQAMQRMAPGAMLSVPLPEEEVLPLLPRDISPAAVNSSSLCTVSGPHEAIETFARELEHMGHRARPLHTSHAFHSAMMEPMLEEYQQVVNTAPLHEPQIPFISNTSGTWITPQQACSPGYWTQQVRRPVRFARGLETLFEEPSALFLECGPGRALGTFLERHQDKTAHHRTLNLARHPREEVPDDYILYNALGHMWLYGLSPDWSAVYPGEQPYRIPLPAYPFQGKAYLPEEQKIAAMAGFLSGDGGAAAPVPAQYADAHQTTEPPDTPEEADEGDTGTPFAPPRDPIEQRLAGAWRELLGFGRIGIHDNFFRLNGDSITAMQILSRVKDMFGVEVAVKDFFPQPTIAELGEHVKALLIEKKKKLPPEDHAAGDTLLSGAPVPTPAAATVDKIPRRTAFSPAPLSFSQRRLWVLDRLLPGNPFYNLPHGLQVTGRIDIPLLEQSIDEIIRRHESLRTVFGMENEEPVQVILPGLHIKLETMDLGGLSPEEQEEKTALLTAREAARPFDLEKGPLVRALLVHRGENRHALLFNMHHIVFDGWSIGIFIRELAVIYHALSTGTSSPPPEPPIQYADFALWQRERMQGELLETQMAYWRNLLSGNLPILELPTDRQRPAVPQYRGSYLTFQVPGDLAQRLNQLNQREQCSMFMTLLAAFNLLLHRYSGRQDILVGSPISNRNRAELEPIIGFFANTTVFRTNLEGNPTFRQLLARVRETATGAYDHQDVPFEKLVEAFQPDRYMSHTPLFQVMFNYSAAREKTGLDTGNLSFSRLPVHNRTSKFDLWLNLAPRAGEEGLGGGIEYNTDIFEEETIQRLADHFLTLLQGIVEDPGESIGRFPLMDETEYTRVLEEWNQTDEPYDLKCLHHHFEEQAAKTPHAIAATGPNGNTLTYEDLNRAVHQTAALLKTRGVGPGTITGIMALRSLEMITAMPAIQKAGGAYLPIDPEYPRERIEYILRDSATPVLITTPGVPNPEETLTGWSGQHIHLDLQTLPERKIGDRQENIHTPAYVIYTSGSTGRPKGVIVEHAGISNRLLWMQQTFNLTSEDRILQKTPYTFDVSVWEFFWPLITGARLVFARPGGHKENAYLADTIIKNHITTIHFVPSMLNAFLEEPAAAKITSLKRVICSGEALPPEYRDRFFARFGKTVELHNLYGPTEASVDVTAWKCSPRSPLRHIPIGRPIANTRIYILTPNLTPTPTNVPGQLHIAGIQLARGYLNKPELTAEKFVTLPPAALRGPLRGERQGAAPPGPPTGKKGDRQENTLYRSGDLVRWMPDGNIEFLGRLDFQVKVRGFRIELGEIESALRAHPFIENAVVLATSTAGDTQKKLVAYIVPNHRHWRAFKAGDEPVRQLRHALKENLPEYMVPSLFFPMESLPLTPSGKLDRKALPSYEKVMLEQVREIETLPPRNERERFFADTWRQILEVPDIGINLGFFQLGGDSVNAVRMISRLNQRGYGLTLQDLYKNQTIAQLAELAEQKEADAPGKAAGETIPSPDDLDINVDPQTLRQYLPEDIEIETILPAMPLQRHMMECMHHRSHPVIEEPVFIYQRRFLPTAMTIDPEILNRSIQVLADAYPFLRTLLIWREEDEPLQVVCTKVEPVLIYKDFSGMDPGEQDRKFIRLMEEEWKRDFVQNRGIPFRLVVVKLGENLVRYFYSGDYSRLDGWDAIFVFRNIVACYEALAAGREFHINAGTMYPSFLSYVGRFDRDRAAAYWRDHFDGFNGPVSYLERFPGNKPEGRGFGQQHLYLSVEATAKLHDVLQKEQLVFSALAYGLWALMLSRYTGDEDIVFSVLTAGRSAALAGIENMRGYTINILPVRFTIPKETRLLDWLRHLLERQLEWVKYEYTQVEDIYKWLELSPRQPLCDSFMVVQNLIRDTSKKNPLYGPDSDYALYHAKMEYPLRLDVDPEMNIGIVFHYHRQCISDTVVRGLQENYKLLLESIITEPAQTVGQLLEQVQPNIQIDQNAIKEMIL